MEQMLTDEQVAKWPTKPLHLKGGKWHVFTILKNHTLALALSIMAAGMVSCQSSPDGSKKPVEDAMSAYNDFFLSIKSKKIVGAEELIALVKEWRILDSNVTAALNSDTTIRRNAHAHVHSGHAALVDSISLQVARLADSQPRSFSDYLNVVRELNNVEMDSVSQKLVASVHLFYHDVGTVDPLKGSAKEVIGKYNRLLDGTLAKGIRTKQDVIDFLRKEDVAFRSFLLHLPALSTGNISLEGITKKTGEIMHGIISLSSDEYPVFGKSEVVILLAMRNNRRLLQNAEACIESLHRLHRTDNGQATAYQWMILQPWISLDGFAYALMDDEQMRTMEKLAEQTPKALAKLRKADCPLDVDSLPELLIKTFILGYE